MKTYALWIQCICITFWIVSACQTQLQAPTDESNSEVVIDTHDGGASTQEALPSSEKKNEKQPDTSSLEVTQPTSENTQHIESGHETQGVESRPLSFGGSRPTQLRVPSSYNASRTYPLLIVLHGYGASGAVQSFYLGLDRLVEEKKILMLTPDGTTDRGGKRFWNATHACCDFTGTKVDDEGYILGLLNEVKKHYNIDTKRVYLLGHSNGGFMSYRMACNASQHFAAIVSLAGAMFNQSTSCTPKEPVSILQIHGTQDKTILYTGGANLGRSYPSALTSVQYWSQYNQCSTQPQKAPTRLDLEKNLPGTDTDVQMYTRCAKGTSVELWSIQQGGHIPTVTKHFAENIWKWMVQHPKTQ